MILLAGEAGMGQSGYAEKTHLFIGGDLHRDIARVGKEAGEAGQTGQLATHPQPVDGDRLGEQFNAVENTHGDTGEDPSQEP